MNEYGGMKYQTGSVDDMIERPVVLGNMPV